MAKKKKLYTRPYDAATYLKTEQECALYLQAAIDESDGDAALVVTAFTARERRWAERC